MSLFRAESGRRAGGFTLLEILMTLSLLFILSVATLEYMTPSFDEQRFQVTVDRMKKIVIGMVGDPDLKGDGVRNSFGFHGDIGALPAAGLSDFGLLTIPAATTTWSVNSTARMGAGWNGPYAALVKPDDDISRDGWGGAFSFSRATSPAYLVSYGADGVAGGTGFNQDITFSIPSDLLLATVTGFVKSAGAPFSLTADVELNIPNGTGAITQSVAHVLASDKGAFTMTSVPQGVRTIKVYYPSKASASWILGPQAITVDRPNSVVPSELLDLQNGTPP